MEKSVDTVVKKRIAWIDFVKGVSMFMIIMCHAGWPYWFERLLNPFFMTTYFFVAGFTFNRRSNFKEFLVAKIKAFIIPLLIFGTINAILAFLADGDSLVTRFSGLLIQRAGHNDDLWFIACLFVLEILFYGVTSVTKNLNVQLLICLIVSCMGNAYIYFIGIKLPWQIEEACVMMIFVCIGHYIKRKNVIDKIVRGGYSEYLLPFILYPC